MKIDETDFNIQFIQKVAMIEYLFYNHTGESTFIKQLMNFDKDNISDRVLKKIGSYCSQSDFQPDIIGRVSGAAKSLCQGHGSVWTCLQSSGAQETETERRHVTAQGETGRTGRR